MTVNIKGYGKITASKAVLNNICILFNDSAKLAWIEAEQQEGEMVDIYNRYGRYQKERSNAIYEELKATGYYDDVR